MIGRERPGQESEVAQLISQTLEQERHQREMMEQQYAQYDADDDEVSLGATLSRAICPLQLLCASHTLPES